MCTSVFIGVHTLWGLLGIIWVTPLLLPETETVQTWKISDEAIQVARELCLHFLCNTPWWEGICPSVRWEDVSSDSRGFCQAAHSDRPLCHPTRTKEQEGDGSGHTTSSDCEFSGWDSSESTQALFHCHTNTALSLLLTFSRHKWARARFKNWISVQREYYTSNRTQDCRACPSQANIIHGRNLFPLPQTHLTWWTNSNLHPCFPAKARTVSSSPFKSH